MFVFELISQNHDIKFRFETVYKSQEIF